jgi:hypothetical protein
MAKARKKRVKKSYKHAMGRVRSQKRENPGTHISDYETVHELPCLVCGEKLKTVGVGNSLCWSQVDGGNVAHMAGNYGSTVYDPPGGWEYLRFVVCDDCLVDRSSRIQHIKWSQPLPVIDVIHSLAEQLVEEGVSPTALALKNMAVEAENDVDDQKD